MDEKKEYIDREAVLTVLKAVFDETDPVGEEQFGVLKAHRIVREAPAADVVEVVRCKNCKYAYINSLRMSELHIQTAWRRPLEMPY